MMDYNQVIHLYMYSTIAVTNISYKIFSYPSNVNYYFVLCPFSMHLFNIVYQKGCRVLSKVLNLEVFSLMYNLITYYAISLENENELPYLKFVLSAI